MSLGNRIKVSATGTTTTMTLGAPIASFVAFPDGETTYTILADDDTWQIGKANVSGATMTIDTVEENSNGDLIPIDFTAKTLQIAEVISSLDFNTKAGNGILTTNYDFDSGVTDADPGTGRVRVNNADPSIATEIYVSTTDRAGNSISYILGVLNENDWISLQDANSADHFTYVLSGASIDNTTYWTIPVDIHDFSGSLNNNERINLQVALIRGRVDSVGGGTDITVDSSDPQNPIVNYDGTAFPNIGSTYMATLEQFYNYAWSAGKVFGGVVTDAGGCNVDVSGAEVVFRTGPGESDPLITLVIPPVIGFVIGAGVAGTLYIDYNGGSPIYAIGPPGHKSDLREQIPIAAVLCDGVNVTILTFQSGNTDYAALITRRLVDLGLAHVPGGTIIGEIGVQNISITEGLFYFGSQQIPNAAVDTSLTDTFTYWYKDGLGGWTSIASQSQIDILQYDDGSGILAALSNNNYNQSWVYLNGSDLGFETHVILGTYNTPNIGEVNASSPPTTIPPILDFLGVLIGRVIIQEGISSFVGVESEFVNESNPGSVTSHNSLAGLQGGSLNERYHLTLSEVQYLSTIPSLFVNKIDSVTVEVGETKITNEVSMTQAAYDLITPNASTIYFIVG